MYGRLFQHMQVENSVPHGHHGGPLVTEGGIGYINIAISPPPTHPRYSPAVPLLYNLLQLCEQVRQRHLRPPISLMISNGRCSDCAYGRFTPTGASMEAVDPSKRARLCDRLCAAVDNITEGLYYS